MSHTATREELDAVTNAAVERIDALVAEIDRFGTELRVAHEHTCGCTDPGSESKCIFWEWESLRAALAAGSEGET